MSRLEQLRPGAVVDGILPETSVSVVDVRWYGSTALELTYTDQDGRYDKAILYRDSEPGISVATPLRRSGFDGNGPAFQLAAEALCLQSPEGKSLDAKSRIAFEQHRNLLREGAVLVAPEEPSEEVRVLFLVEQSVGERAQVSGSRVIARKVELIEVDSQRRARISALDSCTQLRPGGKR